MAIRKAKNQPKRRVMRAPRFQRAKAFVRKRIGKFSGGDILTATTRAVETALSRSDVLVAIMVSIVLVVTHDNISTRRVLEKFCAKRNTTTHPHDFPFPSLDADDMQQLCRPTRES